MLSTPTTSQLALPVGSIRCQNSDFKVSEVLGFDPQGQGEHLWLQIEKTGLNTRDVADQLAVLCNVPARDVNYSGMKDKRAVTDQWFSLPWPIKAELPQISAATDWRIVDLQRGLKRLRLGTHKGNRFELVIRHIPVDACELIDQRLELVAKRGFPNYFGPQRFGHNGANVAQARRLFEGRLKASRFKRGLYLSAARSLLFNNILAVRVQDSSWCRVQHGDVLLLNGSNSRFLAEGDLIALQARHDAGDVHTSGPLYGRGDTLTDGDVAKLEQGSIESAGLLAEGLLAAGLKQERRPLRATVTDLHWSWPESGILKLEFGLQRGVYATSMLQEIISLQDAGNL